MTPCQNKRFFADCPVGFSTFLTNIFSHLDVKSLIICGVVSKIWNKATENNSIWQILCARDFKFYLKYDKINYKNVYKNCVQYKRQQSNADNNSNTSSLVEGERPQKRRKITHGELLDEPKPSESTADLEGQIIENIQEGNIQNLRALICQLPGGVNTELTDGGSFLLYAIDSGSVACAEALLKMGAKIEDHEREYTPLFTAAENGELDVVKLLLKYGTNITGEFDFNSETALSISGFKFCNIFQPFLKVNLEFFLDEYQEAANELLDIWLEYEQWINDNKLPGLWIYFGQDQLQEYASCCLQVFKKIKKETVNDFIKPYLLDEISPLAEIFDLIQHKHQVIKEKPPSSEEDNYATDEDEDLELVYRIEPIATPSKEFQNLTRAEVKTWIDRLNQELKSGKTEREINWEKYPKFFICQYRGVHYYRHYFSKRQRADHRSTFHLNRIAPAGATYCMSNLTPTQHQLARESVLATHRETIIDTFKELGKIGPIKAHWDKKRTFNNADNMMQQRMSNSYAGYMKDVANPQNAITQLLFKRGIKKGYPHYATSDLPRDSLKYTFGQKPIPGLKEWRLRPVFQEDGQALHPYPGKIFMTMFTPLQMCLHDAKHAAGKHNRRHISLKRTVAPERETSMPGGVEPEVSFYEELAVIPSFKTYSEDYQQRYGITSDDFQGYKEQIRLSWVHANKGERDRIRKAVKMEIIEKIIEHKEHQLLKLAQQEAKQRGGYVIFCHHNGHYGINFEEMRLPSKGALSYTSRENAILKNLAKIDEIAIANPIFDEVTAKFSEVFSEQEDEEDGLPMDLSTAEEENSIKSDSTVQGVSWNASTVAARLWKNSGAPITKEMVEKVNKVSIYLKEQGFELCGVSADGDCFLHAFLGSYQTLNKKIPLIDEQIDKIKYLREWISRKFLEKHRDNPKRAQKLAQKEAWMNSDEGDLLTSAFTDIPIRIVTVKTGKGGAGISDMVTSVGSQGLERIDWRSFQFDAYQNFIFIVDLGGHFLYAKKTSRTFDRSTSL